MRPFHPLLTVLLGFCVVACGDAEDAAPISEPIASNCSTEDFGSSYTKPLIQLAHGSAPADSNADAPLVFAPAETAPGETASQTLTIRNVAFCVDLSVSVHLEYETPESSEPHGPSIRVRMDKNGVELAAASGVYSASLQSSFALDGAEADTLNVEVQFLRYPDFEPRAAWLVIENDGKDKDERLIRIPITAALQLDAVVPPLRDLNVAGLDVEFPCPTAIGSIVEGSAVAPQTVLHLDASGSVASSGHIAHYEWQVVQPKGSGDVFKPNRTTEFVTFYPNVVGTYEFRLDVWDGHGVKNCEPWYQTVTVAPLGGIYLELLWDTPGDDDQTDQGPEAGADMDIHLADAAFANQDDIDQDGEPDPWFSVPYDCFFFNPHPNWGVTDPDVDDDPGLFRDDTDGTGPEILSFGNPAPGTYHVGVDYREAFGFGPSSPTLRIWIDGQLKHELTVSDMMFRDLWFAATIEWPSGVITLPTGAGGGPHVTSNYVNPFFFVEP